MTNFERTNIHIFLSLGTAQDGSFENPQHIICFGCEIRIKIREGFQLFPGGGGGGGGGSPNADFYRNPYNL